MNADFGDEEISGYLAPLRFYGKAVAVAGGDPAICHRTCRALVQGAATMAGVDLNGGFTKAAAEEVDGRPFQAHASRPERTNDALRAIVSDLGRVGAAVEIVGAPQGRSRFQVDAELNGCYHPSAASPAPPPISVETIHANAS